MSTMAVYRKHVLRELVVELSDRCPLNCLHCSSVSKPNGSLFLSRGAIRDILHQAKALGTEEICFSGGEPTAATSIHTAVLETAQLGLRAKVFTCGVNGLNGNSLTPLTQNLLRTVKEASSCISFVFGLHGSCASVHDKVTQVQGSFECMLSSLKNCLKAGLSCTANFVPTKLNHHDFENTVNLLQSLGVPKVSLLRFIPQGRGKANRQLLELDQKEEDRLILNIREVRESSTIQLRTGSPYNHLMLENSVPCRAGISKLVVQADGNVIPCEAFKDERRRSWDSSVYVKTFEQILDSPKYIALRRQLDRDNNMRCPVHSFRKYARVEPSNEIPCSAV